MSDDVPTPVNRRRALTFAFSRSWGAMNSLGAGGQATPYLVNASNALTFSLMVLTAFITSILVRYIGVK